MRRQTYTVTAEKPPVTPRAARAENETTPTDANGAPVLLRVSTLLGTLERMLEHRQDALEAQQDSPGVLGYYAKEVKALQGAIAALKFHRATVEQLPQFVTSLRDVLDALEVQNETDAPELHKLAAAKKRAGQVLAEYEHLV